MSRVHAMASIDVPAPQRSVFDYVSDVRRHGEWSPRAYRVEGVADGPVSVGTRYTSIGWLPGDKNHRNDVEVTQMSAPDELVLTATDRGERFVSTFTLAPIAGGTRLTRARVMPKPGGVVGVLFPLILRLLIVPDRNNGLSLLKSRIEAGGVSRGVDGSPGAAG